MRPNKYKITYNSSKGELVYYCEAHCEYEAKEEFKVFRPHSQHYTIEMFTCTIPDYGRWMMHSRLMKHVKECDIRKEVISKNQASLEKELALAHVKHMRKQYVRQMDSIMRHLKNKNLTTNE